MGRQRDGLRYVRGVATSSVSRVGSPVGQIRTAAHRRAVVIDVVSIVEFLKENLGTGLVALIAGVDIKTAQRWNKDAARQPRELSERRLRAAYQVFQELLPIEASATIRAWFMGMNPQLGDQSPAEVIAQDQYREVLAAARAFASGG